nr:unnamed protein product [Mikania micrantha mosaic virus]
NRGFLIVNHFAEAIPSGSMVHLESSLSSTYFVWEKKKLTLFEGNELALYVAPVIPKMVDSFQTRVVYDAESLPDSFKATFFSYKYDAVLQQMVPEIGEIMCKKKSQVMTVCSGEYRRKVPLHLQYENNTIKGDCGSLIMVELEGKMKLVAVHVAGTG